MRLLALFLLFITFETTSFAQTWKALEMHGGGKVTGIVFDPVNPNFLYNRTDVAGLNKSTDGGNTWTSFTLNIPKDNPHNFTTRNLAIDPLHPDTLYYCSGNAPTAGGSSIFKTLDGGNNWSRITNPTNFSGNGDLRWGDETLIIHSTITEILYVGGQPTFSGGTWQNDSGFHKSADGGNTWISIKPATFESAWITAVKFHPTDSNLVYISAAISSRSGINTTQKGLWEYNVATDVLLQLHNEDVAAFDFDAVTNKIVVCRESGINIYDPNTSLWSSIVKPFNANYRYYLRTHPTISGRWYFGASSGYNNSGLVETVDGGTTYHQVKYTGGTNIDKITFPDFAESNTKPGHGNSLAGIYFNPHDPSIAFMVDWSILFLVCKLL